MKQIRKGVFETNSSSSHSISIERGDLNDNIAPDKYGTIILVGGEFGWGYDSFRDAWTKANYAAEYARLAPNSDKLDMLAEVIREHTKAKDVEYVFDTYNHIDHQSEDVCAEAFESEDNLRQFIFCNQSSLVIDNDNH